jgi:hypothetical protein
MKVDFAICGTQKGGTTALDSYLREHPEVCMANRKEVHYFDVDKNFSEGPPDYSSHHSWFDPLAGHRVIGEATPIQRAFSHWNMEKVRGVAFSFILGITACWGNVR